MARAGEEQRRSEAPKWNQLRTASQSRVSVPSETNADGESPQHHPPISQPPLCLDPLLRQRQLSWVPSPDKQHIPNVRRTVSVGRKQWNRYPLWVVAYPNDAVAEPPGATVPASGVDANHTPKFIEGSRVDTKIWNSFNGSVVIRTFSDRSIALWETARHGSLLGSNSPGVPAAQGNFKRQQQPISH